MKKLSVIIPVFNEAGSLLKVLQKIELVNLPSGLAKEIILVDDFSTDGTREILKSLPPEKYKIFYQQKNLGKGAAVRFGFNQAGGDIVIVQDADLEYDPADYPKLIDPILNNQADVVFGSRFLGSEAHRCLFFWHSLGNKFLTILSNIFSNLNLTDMETCYKAFSYEALNKIKPYLVSNRFGIEPEIAILAGKKRLRVFEVGISYNGRTYEEGKKINWRDGAAAVWHIIKFGVRK